MITTQDLQALGFKNLKSPFTQKFEWVIGEEDVEFCGSIWPKQPILCYDIEKQIAQTRRGEFCVVTRKCDTVQELEKFTESIKFLFHISDAMLSLNHIS